MDFDGYIGRLTEKIESELRGYTARVVNGKLREAMEYSLFSGGKRIRPLLALVCAEAEGGGKGVGRAVPFACGVEMIHTYSLIHDDLPAMDDDDFRRGKLSSHKKFGEGAAILAGDALLTFAFEIMAETRKTPRDLYGRMFALEAVARAAGANGMVGGQVSDISADYETVDEGIIESIYEGKTAALIQASAVAGAAVGRGFLTAARKNRERLVKLAGASADLGMAFQYKDDLDDGEGLGKAAAAKFESRAETALGGFAGLYGKDGAPYRLAKKILDK